MSSSRGYWTSSQIFIFFIFIHAHMTYTVSASLQDILGNASKLCNEIEDFPAEMCQKVVLDAKEEWDVLCFGLANKLCNLIPFPFDLIISEGTCENFLKDHVCDLTDFVSMSEGFTVFEEVGLKCVSEVDKMMFGATCNRAGEAIDICEHIPDTAAGICNLIVDAACNMLPLILSPLEGLCQDTFSEIC